MTKYQSLATWCLLYQIKNASPLQSSPHSSSRQTTETRSTNNQLHPTGRRWKRRRKQQTFLPSPHRNITPFDETALVKQLGYVPPNICCVSACTSDGSRTTQESADIDTSSCGLGRPVAIQSYPLLVQKLGKDENANNMDKSNIYKNCNITPFPTMYWLCDTHISRAISELERQGYVRTFQLRLESDPSLAIDWLKCHEQYALERWELLTKEDREWLLSDTIQDEKEQRTIQSMRDMIQHSGVAGTDYIGQKQELDALDGVLFVPSVKCLHSHYAHYRSQLGLECGKGIGSKLNVVGEWTHELLVEKFADIVL